LFYFIQDFEYLRNIITLENNYFEKEINNMKEILDKLTDLCENSAILDREKLIGLKDFLNTNQKFIIKNINL
jgi:hypothetical protein